MRSDDTRHPGLVPYPGSAASLDMPEPGGCVMEHVPGVVTTVKATLMPGQSLTLPPVPADRPTTEERDAEIIEQLKRIGISLDRLAPPTQDEIRRRERAERDLRRGR